MLASSTKLKCITLLCNGMLKKLQLHKSEISNSSKTRPDRKILTRVLKLAPQNYPQNTLKPNPNKIHLNY